MYNNQDFKLITPDMVRLRLQVMSRVRFLRRIRTFLASPASSATVAIICLLCASIFVSFGDIVRNIMVHAEWGGRFSYTYSAIVHARIAVQVLAGLTSVACLILFVKILFRLRTPVYSVGNFLASRTPLRFLRS